MHSSLDKNSAHHLFPNHKPSRPRTLGFAEFHAAHFPPHLPFFRNLINPQRGGFYPQYSLPSEYTHHVDTYSYPQNNIDNEQYEELATQEETEDVEEVNFQLSEETIAMFAFSEKHRLERDAEKSLEAEAQRKEEGEALTVALNSLPTMTSNSITPEEYSVLYGSSGSTIATLEATLNYEYEKGCSENGQKAPSLWPVLPLKF